MSVLVLNFGESRIGFSLAASGLILDSTYLAPKFTGGALWAGGGIVCGAQA